MAERRSAIFARREALAQRSAPRFRWPSHLVTAPHGVRGEIGDRHPTLPYGEWHARRPGSLVTACGRSAVTWPFFWTLDFANAGASACRDCRAALGHRSPLAGEAP